MYYSSYFDRNPDVLPDLVMSIERQNEKTGELTEQLKRLCDILEKKENEEKPLSEHTIY